VGSWRHCRLRRLELLALRLVQALRLEQVLRPLVLRLVRPRLLERRLALRQKEPMR
jgi:hypothetical protein